MSQDQYDFSTAVEGFDLATIAEAADTVFAISPEMTLTYVNPAWHEFARNSHGGADLPGRFGIGSELAGIIPPVLREFYETAYKSALETGTVWQHEYECSSPDTFRLYRQFAYPFRNRNGLLIVNSLIKECPHDPSLRPPFPPERSLYESETGLITLCCNCRRAQRSHERNRWDWVPDWVENVPLGITGGICPLCYDYYWKHPTENVSKGSPPLNSFPTSGTR